MSNKKALGLIGQCHSTQWMLLSSRKMERMREMGICECCGNNYDKSFDVVMNGETYTFDSFECAVHLLAPRCSHCDMKIIGHGVESAGKIFCCANCAKHEGVTTLKDRSDQKRMTQ